MHESEPMWRHEIQKSLFSGLNEAYRAIHMVLLSRILSHRTVIRATIKFVSLNGSKSKKKNVFVEGKESTDVLRVILGSSQRLNSVFTVETDYRSHFLTRIKKIMKMNISLFGMNGYANFLNNLEKSQFSANEANHRYCLAIR